MALVMVDILERSNDARENVGLTSPQRMWISLNIAEQSSQHTTGIFAKLPRNCDCSSDGEITEICNDSLPKQTFCYRTHKPQGLSLIFRLGPKLEYQMTLYNVTSYHNINLTHFNLNVDKWQCFYSDL